MAVQVNDRVRIKSNKYSGILNGLTGTVKSKYLDSVGVAVDGKPNPKSDYGWYYFTSRQLEKLKDEGVTKMEGNYRIALVKFLDGANTDKEYEYACYDERLTAGDKVVVKSAHHGFGVGIITGFTVNIGQDIIREIVGFADFEGYEHRVADRKRRDELRKEMANRAAKLQEIALYAALAKDDPEMCAMLSEYEALIK